MIVSSHRDPIGAKVGHEALGAEELWGYEDDSGPSVGLTVDCAGENREHNQPDRPRLERALKPSLSTAAHSDGAPVPCAAIGFDGIPPVDPGDDGGGCGCNTTSSASGLPLFLLLFLVFRRRN